MISVGRAARQVGGGVELDEDESKERTPVCSEE